jgi:hypothetical protein
MVLQNSIVQHTNIQERSNGCTIQYVRPPRRKLYKIWDHIFYLLNLLLLFWYFRVILCYSKLRVINRIKYLNILSFKRIFSYNITKNHSNAKIIFVSLTFLPPSICKSREWCTVYKQLITLEVADIIMMWNSISWYMYIWMYAITTVFFILLLLQLQHKC